MNIFLAALPLEQLSLTLFFFFSLEFGTVLCHPYIVYYMTQKLMPLGKQHLFLPVFVLFTLHCSKSLFTSLLNTHKVIELRFKTWPL